MHGHSRVWDEIHRAEPARATKADGMIPDRPTRIRLIRLA
jgi:hypothetical protein